MSEFQVFIPGPTGAEKLSAMTVDIEVKRRVSAQPPFNRSSIDKTGRVPPGVTEWECRTVSLPEV
jgi:hypothetical protein